MIVWDMKSRRTEMSNLDVRNCEVCKTNFDWNNELDGCLDIEEILDCSNTQ